MCALAHFFESEGLATVVVGFVREHMQAIEPPRAVWLDFPMGRPLGKPDDPEFQTRIIRTAFKQLEAIAGPVLVDFSESIPVSSGRMSYALPSDFFVAASEIGDVDALVAEASAEIEALGPAYQSAVAKRTRTTVGASELAMSDWLPYIAGFVKGEAPKSLRQGLHPIALLKLVVEDLSAYYTEAWTHQDHLDDFEMLGKRFWEVSKAGRLVLWLEAVALESDDKVLRQIVDMSLITPRFWSEQPLPAPKSV